MFKIPDEFSQRFTFPCDTLDELLPLLLEYDSNISNFLTKNPDWGVSSQVFMQEEDPEYILILDIWRRS